MPGSITLGPWLSSSGVGSTCMIPPSSFGETSPIHTSSSAISVSHTLATKHTYPSAFLQSSPSKSSTPTPKFHLSSWVWSYRYQLKLRVTRRPPLPIIAALPGARSKLTGRDGVIIDTLALVPVKPETLEMTFDARFEFNLRLSLPSHSFRKLDMSPEWTTPIIATSTRS